MKKFGRFYWAIALAFFVFVQIYLLIYQTSISEKPDTISSTQTILSVINIIIIIGWIIWEKRKKRHRRVYNNSNTVQNNSYGAQKAYESKNLFTPAEKELYEKLKHVLRNEDVIIQAQIPLSSVVEKFSLERYAGELYRTIDFGIFAPNGNVIVLIELNDSSHLNSDRRSRDHKVKEILDKARIPLITLWTNQENSIGYIEKRIFEYIRNQRKKD